MGILSGKGKSAGDSIPASQKTPRGIIGRARALENATHSESHSTDIYEAAGPTSEAQQVAPKQHISENDEVGSTALQEIASGRYFGEGLTSLPETKIQYVGKLSTSPPELKSLSEPKSLLSAAKDLEWKNTADKLWRDKVGNQTTNDIRRIAATMSPEAFALRTSEDEKHAAFRDVIGKELEASGYEYSEDTPLGFQLVDRFPKQNEAAQIGGYEFTSTEFAEHMSRYEKDLRHQSLFHSDAQYRNDWLLQHTGFSEERYRNKVADDLEKKVKEIESKLPKVDNSFKATFSAGTPWQTKRPDGGTQVWVAKANDVINTLRKNNFGAGFREGVDVADVLTLGAKGVGENIILVEALNADVRGEKLTQSQQTMVDVWAVQQEAEDAISLLCGRSVGASMGYATSYSAGFMASMMATGGIAKGATAGISKAVARIALKEAVKKGAKEATIAGLKKGGLMLAESVVGAAARTPFTGQLYKGYTGKRLDQFTLRDHVDEAGNITRLVDKTPQSAWKDALKASIETLMEYQSEDMGMWLGSGANAIARRFALSRVGTYMGLNRLAGVQRNAALQWIKSNAKVTNFAGEVLGEAYGDAMVNLFEGNKQGWREMMSKDYWWTLGGVSAILSGSMGATSIPAGLKHAGDISKIEKLKHKSLGSIKNEDLKSRMARIAAIDDITMRSRELGRIDWKSKDIATQDAVYALDFINAQTKLDIKQGEDAESMRLSRFAPYIDAISNLQYKDANGEATGEMVFAKDAEGNDYAVLSGVPGVAKTLHVYNMSSGVKGTIGDSEIVNIETRNTSDFIAEKYAMMFRVQANQEVLDKVFTRAQEAADAGVGDKTISDIITDLGFKAFQLSDNVTLLSGEKGVVNNISGAFYEVVLEDGRTVDCGLNEILQPDPEVAQAQQEAAEATQSESSETESDPEAEQVLAEIKQRVGEIRNADDDVVYTVDLQDAEEPAHILKGASLVYDKQTGEINIKETLRRAQEQGLPETVVVRYADGTTESVHITRLESVLEAAPTEQVINEAHEQVASSQVADEDITSNEQVAGKATTSANPLLGQSLTAQQAAQVIEQMEAAAAPAPQLELTPENWNAEFGPEGKVATPIGEVKMGENQLSKLFLKARDGYFGMIKPTLTEPDIVLEKNAPDEKAERQTKYLFVKTFLKSDGGRFVYFESVTVSKNGMEVAISNHEADGQAIKKEMQNSKILHLSNTLSSGSERYLTETPFPEGPDLVPSSDNGSVHKDTTSIPNTQVSEPEIPRQKNGQPDYNAMSAEMLAVELSESMGHDKAVERVQVSRKVNRRAMEKLRKSLEEMGDLNKATATEQKLAAMQSEDERLASALEQLGIAEDQSKEKAVTETFSKEIDRLFPDGLPNVQSRILADIARGQRFVWTNSSNGAKRGMATELGFTGNEGERRARFGTLGTENTGARHVSSYVHDLWEGSNGYAFDMDDAALRNEVIDVLLATPSRTAAMEQLRDMATRNAEDVALPRDAEDQAAIEAYKSEQEALRQSENNGIFAGNTPEMYGKTEKSGRDNDGRRQTNSRGISESAARVDMAASDRGDIRVFEEGMGSSYNEHPEYSERDRREAESQRLVAIAKESGLYIDPKEWSRFGQKYPKRTGESVVYIDEPNGKVYKIKDPYAKAAIRGGMPEDAIYDHVIHNILFPEARYAFEGISDHLGDARIVLSQNYIESVGQPTQPQIDAALAARGLYPEDKYHYGNDLVSVTDVEGDNALLGYDGKIYFIDPIIRLKKPARDVIDALEADGQQSNVIPEQGISSDDVPFSIVKEAVAAPEGITPERWVVIVDQLRQVIGPGNVVTDQEEVREAYNQIMRRGDEVRQHQIEQANERFNTQLELFSEGKLLSGDKIDLGTPGATLRACGIHNADMTVTQRVLKEHMDKHGLTVDDIRDLPAALDNPIMVYEWGAKAKATVVVTEIVRGDERIAVALKLKPGRNGAVVNAVASVHGKSVERLLADMNTPLTDFGSENLKWVNKEKVLDWIAAGDSFGPSGSSQGLVTATNIVTNFENPKIGPENMRRSIVSEETQNNIQEEKDAIQKQAKADGTYLKAPNGNPTNLTANQWKTVRTQAFKKWFGDWENDPASASTVVDKNGEPLVVYHGTPKRASRKFNIFNTENAPAWFSSYREYAKVYANEGQSKGLKRLFTKENIYDVFLNIKHPVYVGSIGWGSSDQNLMIRDLAKVTGLNHEDLKPIFEKHGRVLRLYEITNSKSFKDLIIQKGYDGIVALEGGITTYAVNTPEQVKSAKENIGTYDSQNPHIRYFRTPEGEVYGFTTGGKVYLDSSRMNAATPMHEYTELWSQIVAREQPELWARGAELMKQTKVWAEVNADPNYKQLSEDMRVSETLSRIVAEEFAGEQAKITDDSKLIGKLRAWLRKFWKSLKETFSKWSKTDLDKLTGTQFAKMPLRDFVEGIDLRKYNPRRGEDTQITTEKTKIRETAQAAGAYLKAPNGKPTKLTTDQWETVRTGRFKNWFGDWENDSANASKVVDENGEPKVMYHGSPLWFHEFKHRFIGLNGTAWGQGFYFSPSKDVAQGYTTHDGRMLEVYLNIRKPLSLERKTITRAQYKKFIDVLDRYVPENGDEPMDILSNYGDVEYEGRGPVLNDATQQGYEGSKSDAELVGSLINASGDAAAVESVLKKTLGYDGIIAPNGLEFIVTNSSDIKSATDNSGAFDAANPDIRFSRALTNRKVTTLEKLENKRAALIAGRENIANFDENLAAVDADIETYKLSDPVFDTYSENGAEAESDAHLQAVEDAVYDIVRQEGVEGVQVDVVQSPKALLEYARSNNWAKEDIEEIERGLFSFGYYGNGEITLPAWLINSKKNAKKYFWHERTHGVTDETSTPERLTSVAKQAGVELLDRALADREYTSDRWSLERQADEYVSRGIEIIAGKGLLSDYLSALKTEIAPIADYLTKRNVPQGLADIIVENCKFIKNQKYGINTGVRDDSYHRGRGNKQGVVPVDEGAGGTIVGTSGTRRGVGQRDSSSEKRVSGSEIDRGTGSSGSDRHAVGKTSGTLVSDGASNETGKSVVEAGSGLARRGYSVFDGDSGTNGDTGGVRRDGEVGLQQHLESTKNQKYGTEGEILLRTGDTGRSSTLTEYETRRDRNNRASVDENARVDEGGNVTFRRGFSGAKGRSAADDNEGGIRADDAVGVHTPRGGDLEDNFAPKLTKHQQLIADLLNNIHDPQNDLKTGLRLVVSALKRMRNELSDSPSRQQIDKDIEKLTKAADREEADDLLKSVRQSLRSHTIESHQKAAEGRNMRVDIHSHILKIYSRIINGEDTREELPRKVAARINALVTPEMMEVMGYRDFQTIVNEIEKVMGTQRVLNLYDSIREQRKRIDRLKVENTDVKALKPADRLKVEKANAKALKSAEDALAVSGQKLSDYLARSRPMQRIAEAVADMDVRSAKSMFDKILKLKVEDLNASGVKVAKTIDEDTRQFFKILRDNLDSTTEDVKIKINKLIDEEVDSHLTRWGGLVLHGMYRECVRMQQEIDTLQNEITKFRTDSVTAYHKTKNTKLSEAVRETARAQRAVARKSISASEATIIDIKQQMAATYTNIVGHMRSKIETGRMLFSDMEDARIERRKEIISQSIKTASPSGGISNTTSKFPKVNKVVRWATSPFDSFENMLQTLSINYPGKDGPIYSHFMLGKDGWAESNSRYQRGRKDAMNKILEAYRSKVDSTAKKMDDIFRRMQEPLLDDDKQPFELQTPSLGTYRSKTIAVTRGKALVWVAWSRQRDLMPRLEREGITPEMIDKLETYLGPQDIDFLNWVQQDMLPGLLKSKYNPIYMEMFGTRMDETPWYFPFVSNKNSVHKEVDMSIDKEDGLPSTITGNIIKRKNSLVEPDLEVDFISVLTNHINEMEHWSAFAKFTSDINALLSSTTFRNALESQEAGTFRRFKSSCFIAAGAYSKFQPDPSEQFLTRLERIAAMTKISWRVFTALKQLLSGVLFRTYTSDLRFQGIITNHLDNPIVWKDDWKWCMKNLPSFRERWESRYAGDERLALKGPDRNWISQWMFKQKRIHNARTRVVRSFMYMNAAIDAMTCAKGAHAVYIFEYKRLQEQGMDAVEADRMAKNLASIAMNTTQQSSEAAYLSPIQSDRTLGGAAVSIFNNSSFAYGRIVQQGFRTLTMSSAQRMRMRNAMIDKYQRQGMAKAAAEAQAEKDMQRMMKDAALKLAIAGYLANLLWNLFPNAVSACVGAFNRDDDDENGWNKTFWRKMRTETSWVDFVAPTFRNFGGGNHAESVFNGFPLALSMFVGDFGEFIKEVKGLIDEFSPATAAYLLAKISSWSIGVDFDTFVNMYKGAEKIGHKHERTAGIFQALNSPKRIIAATEIPPGSGETREEYLLRMAYVNEVAQEDIERIENTPQRKLDKRDLNTQRKMKKWARNYKASKHAAALNMETVRDKFGSVTIPELKQVDNDYDGILKYAGFTQRGRKSDDLGKEWSSLSSDEQKELRAMGDSIREIYSLEEDVDKNVIFNNPWKEQIRDMVELKRRFVEQYNNKQR